MLDYSFDPGKDSLSKLVDLTVKEKNSFDANSNANTDLSSTLEFAQRYRVRMAAMQALLETSKPILNVLNEK